MDCTIHIFKNWCRSKCYSRCQLQTQCKKQDIFEIFTKNLQNQPKMSQMENQSTTITLVSGHVKLQTVVVKSFLSSSYNAFFQNF